MVVRVGRADYLTLALRILLVAVAYYAAARIGLELALVRGQVTPLWPPTGIALTCLLMAGIRCWPGISIGAFAVNITIGPSLPAVLVISLGNTLGPICAALLLTRVGFRPAMDRIRDVLTLVFLGASGAMLISSTIGTATLVVSGALPPGAFWSTWLVWWTGDALGVLVVTPVLLVLCPSRWRGRVRVLRLLEGAALVLGIVGLIILAGKTATPVFFLAFPPLVWAALRFQHAGAAPCALIMSLIAAMAAARGTGPFAGLDLVPKMITLQAFNASTALTALLLAAITTQRNEALRSVERAVAELSNAVATLEPYSLLRDGMLDNVLRERTARD